MRSLILIVGFAGLGLGFVLLDRATRPIDRTAVTGAEAFDLTSWLSKTTGLVVDGLVLAPSIGKERDFRGLQSTNGRLRPVYGRLRQVCGGTPNQSECWEIAYLEIDGKQVDYSLRTAARPGRTDGDGADHGADEVIETADSGPAGTSPAAGQVIATTDSRRSAVAKSPPETSIGEPVVDERVVAPPEDLGEANATGRVPIPTMRPAARSDDRLTGKAATPRLGTPDPQGRTHKTPSSGKRFSDVAPIPTHRVDRPIVNARNGPGTGNPAIGRLSSGLDLSLVKTDRDWGQFLVLEGALTGQIVWVAMDILRTAR